jgi:catecholate siderophore receptor
VELPVTEFGVPLANFYGYEADTDDVKVSTLTALLRHDVNEYLRISSDTKFGVYDRYFRQTVAGCAAATCGELLLDGDPATLPLVNLGGPGPYEQTTRGIQNVTTALFTMPLRGMRNEFVVAWDLSYQTNDRTQFNYAGTRAAKDIFAPAHAPSPLLATTLNNVRETTGSDYALIVDDRLWLHPEFSVNVGVRMQRFTNEQEQTGFAQTTACNGVAGTFTSCAFVRESKNELVNPKVAGVWEPTESISVYLSYSRAAVPPGNSVGNGDALAALAVGNTLSTANLDPEKSAIIDFGAKFALFDQRMLLQAGLYQIDRTNAQETDPQSGNTLTSGEPGQRLRGVELGLSGALSDSWLLTANYAYVDAEIMEAFTGNPRVVDQSALGRQVRYVPKHAASAWATWQPLMGALQGLELGAGLSYQSVVYLNQQNTQQAPAYTAFDALLGYRIAGVRLALNAYNLTDEKYYSQVNGGRVVPAAGRSFVASLNYSF